MNISIGNNRWIKFERDVHGEWRGQGYGYRFHVTRSRGTYGSPQWSCRIYGIEHAKRVCIASHAASKLKSAIQEGARLADVEVAKLAVEIERQLGGN